MTPPAAFDRYQNRGFPAKIISHGVWLYYRFCLSYRDVEELLFVRGHGQRIGGNAPSASPAEPVIPRF
jgi:hypothetical protein